MNLLANQQTQKNLIDKNQGLLSPDVIREADIIDEVYQRDAEQL